MRVCPLLEVCGDDARFEKTVASFKENQKREKLF
jgi:hypothetical protein